MPGIFKGEHLRDVPLTHTFMSVHGDTRVQITMDVLSLIKKHEPEIKSRFGVATIGVFGSFVRGEERPDSDVDVLVTFCRGKKTYDNYINCKFYLEDLFGRRVDLVMRGAIKKQLRPYILGEVVYA